MPPYDDWNKIDEEEEEELQDFSFDSKRDVILFCIDCSESMLQLYEDPKYDDVQTCHLFNALEAAVQIQKKKIIGGPNDSVGILLFNTIRKSENNTGQGSEIKRNTYLFQPIAPLGAPQVQEIIHLLDAFREDNEELRRTFPPLTNARVPMGDIFTSCNWVIRDGAPKTASKRVFLITDEDNPHASTGSKQLITSARTTLVDLTQAGVTVEPFFITTEEKPFSVSKFYSSVLLPTNLGDEDDVLEDSSILPESISISRIEDLLSQMRFHEVPKRALFSVPFELGDGFKIGIKGYGLVTEQKKGTYKYFIDLGDRMEVATVKTTYVDEDRQAEVEKTKIVYGPELGASAAGDEDEEDEGSGTSGVRVVKSGSRPCYTSEEIRAFRTLDCEPGIKLLGFKPRSEFLFEDNVKHSLFIYPDEMSYSGSKRTFTALLRTMLEKDKIAIVLALVRRNAAPIFAVLLPQEEKADEGGWVDPAGFHLIPLPFADDIRAAPIEKGFRASEELQDLALAWIEKLSVKNGTYPPDSYLNPALAYHNAQLEASAFREEFDKDSFEDLTEPKYEMIRKRAGKLIKDWKSAVTEDSSANLVAPAAGSKRKAVGDIPFIRSKDIDLRLALKDITVDEAEIKSKYDSGSLGKLRVDQLKEFLKAKGQNVSGKKAELIERVSEWFDAH